MDAETETTTTEKESRCVSWADKRAVLQEAGLTSGVCLRVLENGGQGLVTSRTVDPNHFNDLKAQALEMARVSPVDPHRRFAAPATRYPDDFPIDDSLFKRSLEDMGAELSKLEERILKVDRRIKKVVKLQYSENRSWTRLENTLSVRLSHASSNASFVAEVLAEEAGETEVAWDFQSRRTTKGWSLVEMAESVAEQAARSLGGKQIPSGSYTVIVHPRVGTQLLSLLSNALSAEAVQLGRSFFRGKIHQLVAAPCVTLTDDALLQDGLASAPFDDEGTPHETCAMVVGGILNDYFYDLRSASKENRSSNGHGMKESLAAVPRPASTNFYMKAGSARLDEMLGSHPQVFYLRDVMGLHMADPITGEFSLGAAGFLYENGKRSRPVRGVTIAGSLASVLKNVSAVGSDLTWYGSTGAPSFLLSQVMIAGK